MNALQNVLFKGKSLVVELSAENAYGYKFVCKKDEDVGRERRALLRQEEAGW